MTEDTQKKLRPLIIYSPFYEDSTKACSIRIKNFVNQMLAEGIDVKVLSSDPSGGGEGHSVLGSRFFFKTPSNKASFSSRFLGEVLLGIELCIKLLFRRKSFILLTCPPYISTLIAALFLRLLSRPFAMDIRDLYPHLLADYGILKEDSFAYRFLLHLTQTAYSSAQLISAATDGMTIRLEEMVENDKPALTIANGFDESDFDVETIKSYKPNKRLVFQGNLGKFQGLETFLLVAKKLEEYDPEIQIDVFGDGPGRDLIEAYEGNNITNHGPFSHDVLVKKLPHYALGLSFRSDSGYDQITFPVRIYEYIGAGLPVICAPKAPSYTSEIELNGLGFVFANDEVTKMAETIYQAVENQELLFSLRENVFKKRPQFTRHFAAKELSLTLKDLLLAF